MEGQAKAKGDKNTVTFVLEDEDHTFGAVIVDVLNSSPEVLFAGYTVPHPSERKVHVCVQTADTTTPAAAFKDAARRLAELCKSTKAHFKTKMAEYDNTMRD